MLGTLLVSLAWLFSIYGWSITHRGFEVAETDVELGPAVRAYLGAVTSTDGRSGWAWLLRSA